jgi:mono/diheme cytochrome c family protein
LALAGTRDALEALEIPDAQDIEAMSKRVLGTPFLFFAAVLLGAGAARSQEPSPPPAPDAAADSYLSRCAGCHTIGEGYLSGPDLAPSTGWPAEDLAKAVERMEKNVGPMTGEEVAALVELLRDETVKARLSAARERQVAEMAATLEPASPAAGEALFHGGRPLRNAGLACSACHLAGSRGGNLAVDLTGAAARLGEPALVSAAENPGFPLMRAAYARHPVTRQEALHLAAYLQELDGEAGDGRAGAAAARRPAVRLGLWGSAGAALFLAAMVLFYRDRNRGVRARLVRRARQR